MENIFVLLFLLSIIAMIMGLFKPSLVIRWCKHKTRVKAFYTYLIFALIFFILIGITAKQSKENIGLSKNNKNIEKKNDPIGVTKIQKKDNTLTESEKAKNDITKISISAVSDHLKENKLNITKKNLKSKKNPKGEGMFVYVSQTRFSGVKRQIIWIVISENVFPINGATKNITPSLPWPREASSELWSKTGLSPYSASEALDIVFGK